MKVVQETWTPKQKVLMTSKDANPGAVFGRFKDRIVSPTLLVTYYRQLLVILVDIGQI